MMWFSGADTYYSIALHTALLQIFVSFLINSASSHIPVIRRFVLLMIPP